MRPVVVLTAFHRFAPAYSLCHVVREQLLAFLHLGHPTTLLVNVRFNAETLDAAIREHPLFQLKQEVRNQRPQALLPTLQALPADALVISHDLLFVEPYEALAMALHQFVPPPSMSFYHLSHSTAHRAPRIRPASFRHSVPAGHRLLALSQVERSNLAHYYAHPQEQIPVLPNHLAPMLGDEALALAERSGLLDAEYAAVSALSMPRAEAKGLAEQMRLIKALGPTARLLVAGAHANQATGASALGRAREQAQQLGVAEQVTFASDLGANLSEGVSNQTVRELLTVSNLFLLTSQAEACPLALMEAALAGCLLVVNRDLVGVQELIEPGEALVVPLHHAIDAKTDAFYGQLATQIAVLLDTPLNTAKRRMLRERGRSAYRLVLQELADS